MAAKTMTTTEARAHMSSAIEAAKANARRESIFVAWRVTEPPTASKSAVLDADAMASRMLATDPDVASDIASMSVGERWTLAAGVTPCFPVGATIERVR